MEVSLLLKGCPRDSGSPQSPPRRIIKTEWELGEGKDWDGRPGRKAAQVRGVTEVSLPNAPRFDP
jgi:hypothetical protein